MTDLRHLKKEMGWENRRGKLYYYRKERVAGGRVRSIYFGRGDRAIEASLADGVVLPENVVKSGIQGLTPDLKTLANPSIPPLETPGIEVLAKARAVEAVSLEEKLSLLRKMIVS